MGHYEQQLPFIKLKPTAIAPIKGSIEASGMDLSAYEDTMIPAGKTVRVETGIAFDIPFGLEVQVRPRSGLSLKTYLRVANSPGTVDSDYQGDCSVILHNTGTEDYQIRRGDRIAQAVLCPIIVATPVEVTEFIKKTIRGTNGFGSTGK